MNYDEFLDLVASSRSYRRFDEAKKIGRADLKKLVACARVAPCGNNLQVLRFRLMDAADEVAVCLAHHKWAGLIKEWDGPSAGERPVAYIAILAPEGQGKNPIRNQDAGIAAQTMMLAAATLGLGGCMVKSYDAGLDADLGIAGTGYETTLLLALGYPTEHVVLEEADEGHGVAYWHDDADANHVPKRSVAELLV